MAKKPGGFNKLVSKSVTKQSIAAAKASKDKKAKTAPKTNMDAVKRRMSSKS